MAPPAPLTFDDFERLGRELIESGWAGRADETVADLRRREQAEAITLAGAAAGGSSSVVAAADAAAAREAGSGLRGALPLRPARVLEVVGPTASGKSELLCHVAARFLVSSALEELGRRWRQQQQQQQGGAQAQQQEQEQQQQQHAVLLDMDGKLSLERLHRVVSAHAKAAYRGHAAAVSAAAAAAGQQQQGEEASAAAAAAAAAAAEELLAPMALLRRLHVAQPRSSLELLSTLAALPERMTRAGGRWRLLLMDGAAAFAWRDRAAGAGGSGGGNAATAAADPALSHMRAQTAAADLVAALGERLRVATVVTRRARVRAGRHSSSAGGGGGGGAAGGQLSSLAVAEQPAPRWQALVAQRLVLAPPPPLQAALAQRLAVPGSATALLAQWQQGGSGAGGGGGNAAADPSSSSSSSPIVGLWALEDGRLLEDAGTVAANRAWISAFG